MLGNMGFEPEGENLSLIMYEVGKGDKAGNYIINTRMGKLIEELNVDRNRITGVSHNFHKSVAWNAKMMALTALFCAFSITPYIYLNLVPNNLKTSTRWLFPVLRASGGFFTATFIQLLIQRRITALSNQYLVNNTDVETVGDTNKYQMIARRIAPTWLLFCFLLIGVIASLVGYIGCFSVVQNSTTTIGPVTWLGLEAALSVMRLIIWALNPTKDDAPPLEINLKMDEREPLPTCNKYNEEIFECKVLPLTRARDFLNIITSFAGLIKPFSNPDLSLYYTLTRKRPSKKSVSGWVSRRNRDNEPENAEEHKHGERTLFITVFDPKERTTRVYTRDNDMDIFYSTTSDAPLVDVKHFILEVKIDAKIDPEGDPVCSNNLDSLKKHHRSILGHIQYRLGTADVNKTYAIENRWTMEVEDTVSTLEKFSEHDGGDCERDVEKGKGKGRIKEPPVSDYFMHSSIESQRLLLDEKRGKWIARRMGMIIEETREGFQGEIGAEYRVNKEAVEKKPAPKDIDGCEWYYMELLLVCEVREWEQLFWDKFKAFLNQIGNDRMEEKRLTEEWRANCWRRLNTQMDAAVKRMADVDNMTDQKVFLNSLGEELALSINRFFKGDEEQNLTTLSKLMKMIDDAIEDDDDHRIDTRIHLRMEKEIEDTKFRLKRGSKLGRFDQFWDDDGLFNCRYSQSKWLYLEQNSTVPLEIYLEALKRNKNITHITFGGFDDDQIRDIICHLPWVTSISLLPRAPSGSFGSFGRKIETAPFPSAIYRDFLFIKSSINDLITFAKEITGKLDSSSTYNFLDIGDSYEFRLPAVSKNARVVISFVAPKSDETLTLRVKHSGRENGPLEVTLRSSMGSSKIQLNSYKYTPTIDDITLYPNQLHGPSESDRLSFEPEIRNDILIQFRETVEERGHFLGGVVLLDEAGLEYMPYSASSSR